jgi:alpha-L-rhamnosidase
VYNSLYLYKTELNVRSPINDFEQLITFLTICKMKTIGLLYFLIFVIIGCTPVLHEELIINELRCEYIANPLGIDEKLPRFSWQFSSTQNDKMQTAYRILVASDKASLDSNTADIWDSGKINSSSSTNVVYNGKELVSFKRYYWKVMAWDEDQMATEWSQVNYFETAMLNKTDWNAKWIGDGKPLPERDEDFYKEYPAPLFRKTFQLINNVKQARLYIAGLGYYEAYLNGKKIGDHVLDPGWTNYGKRVLYETYDITGVLNQGSNALGIMLGNGWYNPLPLGLFRKFNLRKFLTVGKPKVIVQIRIEYENGDIETIISDKSWKTHDSFILKNDVYLGEMQDATRIIKDWDQVTYSVDDWPYVVEETEPGGTLKAQMTPPIKITAQVKPIEILELGNDVYIYDLGQNFAGWINFKVRSSKGTHVKFLYGELLNEDGSVNGMTTVAGHIKEIWNLSGGPGAPKTAFQIDDFIASGSGADIFQQHFTFHGFRYVQISGLGYKPELEDLVGLRLSASLERIGSFNCSNERFNQIQEIVDWTFLSNVFSVQSDCPGREKFGYGADIVTSAEAFIYNFDMTNFYRKTVNDFANDVRPNGGMPECAPYNGIDSKGFGEGTGPIGWQLAFPFVQKLLYTFYGDKRVIEENYELTKGMIDFLKSQAIDNLIYHGISDHVSVDPKPEALTSGALYYHNVKLFVEFADILGKTDDIAKYGKLLEDIKESFIARYLDPGTGRFDTLTTQITQVFALYYNLIPAHEKEKAFAVLVEEILDTYNGHLSTGIFGTKMLYDVLRLENRNDIAFTITNQKDYPGYGYMLENDATTLWENWDYPDQNSLNHPMFGSVSEWYYRSLVGINPKIDAVGFDRIVIKPFIVGDLEFVKGAYKSIKGIVTSSWKRKGKKIDMQMSIPPNVNTEIHVPAKDPENVVINGLPALSNPEFELIEFKDSYAVFKAGNGRYEISTEL